MNVVSVGSKSHVSIFLVLKFFALLLMMNLWQN